MKDAARSAPKGVRDENEDIRHENGRVPLKVRARLARGLAGKRAQPRLREAQGCVRLASCLANL